MCVGRIAECLPPVADHICVTVAARHPQFQQLAYDDAGHDVDGIKVPTQGFNVFAALTNDSCMGTPGDIYCLGKYKDDGDNDANAAASYVGREWSGLAPNDPAAPGGVSG